MLPIPEGPRREALHADADRKKIVVAQRKRPTDAVYVAGRLGSGVERLPALPLRAATVPPNLVYVLAGDVEHAACHDLDRDVVLEVLLSAVVDEREVEVGRIACELRDAAEGPAVPWPRGPVDDGGVAELENHLGSVGVDLVAVASGGWAGQALLGDEAAVQAGDLVAAQLGAREQRVGWVVEALPQHARLRVRGVLQDEVPSVEEHADSLVHVGW